MKRYAIAVVAVAAIIVSACSSVTTKHFKVFADPPDSVIRVVSGVELRELKFRSPAAVTAEMPMDPALSAKAVLEVSKENYKPRTIALRYINEGDTLNIKLEKIRDVVRYRLSFRLIRPVVSNELKFRDKAVAVSFAVSEQSFQMHFDNMGTHDLKILWERAEYTDINKQQHRIMPSGVRYQDRNNPIPDQPVPAHASVQEAVIPVSSVYMSEQKQGYDVHPLFPISSDAAAGLKGRTINLFIPVEIDRQIIPYNFNIEIVDSIKEAIK